VELRKGVSYEGKWGGGDVYLAPGHNLPGKITAEGRGKKDFKNVSCGQGEAEKNPFDDCA